MAQANMPYGGGHAPYGLAATRPGYSQGYHAQTFGYGADEEAQSDGPEVDADSSQSSGGALSGVSQVVGALVSVGLIVGVSLWGYELIQRDVSGVPVVRASGVPMRVAPETPGGAQAAHQGLSVNEVAGRGAAGGPADQLRLAPTPLDLTDEDQPTERVQLVSTDATAPVASTTGTDMHVQDQAFATPSPEAAEDAQIDAIQTLADKIAADVDALRDLAPDTDAASALVPEQTDVAGVRPGAARSLRPQARPSALVTASLRTPAAPTAVAVADVDPTTLPAGTRLVQLGAYDSVETAQAEWTRIAGRFDSFFQEKRRVIERAEAGGRTFYRLRAEGFSDLGDARRFCAALTAERTDCIPVVTR